MNSDFERFT